MDKGPLSGQSPNGPITPGPSRGDTGLMEKDIQSSVYWPDPSRRRPSTTRQARMLTVSASRNGLIKVYR